MPPLTELTPLAWAVLAVGAFVVGVSKTALPGAGTVVIAIFAAVLPARASTGALLGLLLIADLFALALYRRDADLGVLRRLAPPVIVGLLGGALFLLLADDAGVRVTIGVILLALIVLTLARRWVAGRRARRTEGGAGPGPRPDPEAGERAGEAAETGAGPPRRAPARLYGSIAGFTTMVANAGGPAMSLYLISMRLDVRGFLGTSAWSYFAVNLSKVPLAVGIGTVTGRSLLFDLILLPAIVLGALSGRAIVARIRPAVFERLVIALTVVGAINLLIG